MPRVADGSDLITVVAAVTDNRGTTKRLHEEAIRFTVSGAGSLVGNAKCGANPKQLRWGTAPILVRAGTKPGDITIKAESFFPGVHSLIPTSVTITTVAPSTALITPACNQQDLVGGVRVDATGTQVDLSEVELQQVTTEGQPAGTK